MFAECRCLAVFFVLLLLGKVLKMFTLGQKYFGKNRQKMLQKFYGVFC